MKPLPSKEDWKKAKEIIEDADKYDFSKDGLEEAIAEALADQREADAKIADRMSFSHDIAAAIRKGKQAS